jgi:2-(3-amino-3-carboxypropyl)histidine synthase
MKSKKPAILYIEALDSKTKPEDYFIDPNFIKILPPEVFLAYILQFKGQAEQMKKAIEKSGRKIKGFQQVLGCTKLKTPYYIVLIGNGSFHALNLARQNEHVLLYSNGSSMLIGERERAEYQKRIQASRNLFLHANTTGLIVSTKPGQNRLNDARTLIAKLTKKYPQKNFYCFISSHINLREFENFSIDFWINTACPGLINDSPKIANIDDISGVL